MFVRIIAKLMKGVYWHWRGEAKYETKSGSAVDQEPITQSVHLHCVHDPTHAQTELFLDMCFPRTSVSAAVRI